MKAKETVAERLSHWWAHESSNVLVAMPWLRDLRPLWWAVRGLSLAVVPALALGKGILWLGAVISIALGLLARHGRITGVWVRPVRVIGNVAAVLLLPVVLTVLAEPAYDEPTYSEVVGAPVGLGLSNEGEPVANIYAYDVTGRRLDDVRLFDQNGRALVVSEEALASKDTFGDLEQLRNPSTGELTVARDIFPLRWNDRTGWERMGDTEWEPPVAITPLPGPVPSVEVSPTPSPTVTATTTPTPAASPQVSPTSPGAGATATPTPTRSASPSASR